jgi:hypothetical protein
VLTPIIGRARARKQGSALGRGILSTAGLASGTLFEAYDRSKDAFEASVATIELQANRWHFGPGAFLGPAGTKPNGRICRCGQRTGRAVEAKWRQIPPTCVSPGVRRSALDAVDGSSTGPHDSEEPIMQATTTQVGVSGPRHRRGRQWAHPPSVEATLRPDVSMDLGITDDGECAGGERRGFVSSISRKFTGELFCGMVTITFLVESRHC